MKFFLRKTWLWEVNPYLKNEILVRNSSTFNFEVPKDNNFGVPPGTYPAVVDGYYLPLDPLPPGEHLLKYKVVYKQPTPGPLKKYIPGEVTYFLTVKP